MRLDGQSALVTGADTGLGRAIALELARAGANVAINYRANAAGAEEVAHAVEACGQKALVVQADVSDEDAVARLYQQAIDHFGTLHVSVSNAGLQRDVAFEDMTLAQWHAVLDVNLTGQFLCCRAAIREFLRRDVDPAVSCARGKIICMSSVHQAIPWAGHVNYAVSKGGVMQLAKSIAQEFAGRGIRANAIAPGAIRTGINTESWQTEQAYRELMRLVPYKRIGEPQDVGRAAAWLAADASDYVTGTTLFVDGGMMLYPGFADGG
ncbi:MAG TPA: glucose 1-dehydrogenase [Salinisphaeraceae bacterium]|nr:glucose 1-dehydrogenase [Salinisphaeraceae bacterium]